MIENTFEKIKADKAEVARALREKTLGYLLGGLGLVAGLAWNDAIKAAIDYVLPASSTGIVAKFGYAAIVTVLIVVATVYLSKLLAAKEETK